MKTFTFFLNSVVKVTSYYTGIHVLFIYLFIYFNQRQQQNRIVIYQTADECLNSGKKKKYKTLKQTKQTKE